MSEGECIIIGDFNHGHIQWKVIKKIMYKQTMWRVYKHARKDEDYRNYKEALNHVNAAMIEIRKSKSYGKKMCM